MNRITLSVVFTIAHVICLFLFFALPAIGNNTVCGDFPTYSPDSVSAIKHKGWYGNYSWGYSVVIPEGLIGVSDPPDHPQHGFCIELSKDPYGYIWVDGSSNSLEWKSKNEAANAYLAIIKEGNRKILSTQKYKVKLNGFPALRLVVRYACPDVIRIRDYFIAIDRRQIVYTIGLSTAEDGYGSYKKILENIANTWQLQKIE
jgi:hypothetical protein